MSFALYVLGFLILIVGLVMGAQMLHVPPRWIGVGVVVLVGLGVQTGGERPNRSQQYYFPQTGLEVCHLRRVRAVQIVLV